MPSGTRRPSKTARETQHGNSRGPARDHDKERSARGARARKKFGRKINHLKMRAQKHRAAKLVHLQKRAGTVKLDVALIVLGAFGTDLELPRHKRNRRANAVDLGGEGIVRVVQGEHPVTVATVTQHQKVAQKYSTEVTGNTSAKNSARASRSGHFSVLKQRGMEEDRPRTRDLTFRPQKQWKHPWHRNARGFYRRTTANGNRYLRRPIARPARGRGTEPTVNERGRAQYRGAWARTNRRYAARRFEDRDAYQEALAPDWD